MSLEKALHMRNNITIVMYHYVRDLKRSEFPDIKGLDLPFFEGQIAYLKKNYNLIKMEDMIAAIDGNRALPAKAALLTFDDGFKDHYANVFPVLKKNRIQGSFYPSAKPVVENIVLDVHKIHFLLAKIKDTKSLS